MEFSSKAMWLSIFISLAPLASVNAVGLHGFHFKGLVEPEWIGTRILNEKWIEQPVDHFNHRDNRTWQMRYYEEDQYFNASGPIFIMLGGEWEINKVFLQSGLMYELAKQHRAFMFYTEHRFYGNSRPTQNLSVESLQYLSVDQALADVAYFVDHVKAVKNISDSKVIVFGGSYAGNMAAWIRIKYPHLIQGAVASSAPVYAKADFHEYYDVVANSLEHHDPKCAASVERAFGEVEELLAAEGAAENISATFNLCKNINIESSTEVAFLMNYLSEIFAGTVQYNTVVNGTSSIGKICTIMTNSTIGSSVDRLAHLIKTSKCNDNADYSEFLKQMRSVEWNSESILRQWQFQTCTEFGYYQTASSNESIFGTLFDLDFFVDLCTDVYGKYYDVNLVNFGVNRSNIVYGGKLPDVRNVVFVNGDVDPWHRLSVLEDLNEFSPAIFIRGSSHCQDLKADHVQDSPELTEGRKKIRKIVSSWL